MFCIDFISQKSLFGGWHYGKIANFYGSFLQNKQWANALDALPLNNSQVSVAWAWSNKELHLILCTAGNETILTVTRRQRKKVRYDKRQRSDK
jgi:hypothetical protein